MRASDRKRLYPALGHLYPAGTSMLADVGDEDAWMYASYPAPTPGEDDA